LLGVELDLDANVSAQRACQHLAHAAQVLRKVDRLRIDRLASGECEKVPREAGSSRYRAAHRLQDFLRLLGRWIALEHLHTTREHGEQVVEVVRDAAWELAQRFEALRP